ncbi:MAG: 3-isopropylmalate dehydratase small subunit [Burkholderiales bacterium PBB5]|nr:MAG: 3-isopropylmalate dehydratase small subunit [Burkholderiales bacterium PBB5]
MQAFTALNAVALPLDLANVDTDQIIPARFLGMPRAEQREAMFRDLRFDPQGQPRPDFVMNQAGHAGAQILVADHNFGCGSSRENAVTVMVDNGFQAFVAPSFGDIFFNNCFQNGVLPVVLPADTLAAWRTLLQRQPGGRIAIDLETQRITGPDGSSHAFNIDPLRKQCLLQGVDDIGLTLGYGAEITRFEAQRRINTPWL